MTASTVAGGPSSRACSIIFFAIMFIAAVAVDAVVGEAADVVDAIAAVRFMDLYLLLVVVSMEVTAGWWVIVVTCVGELSID